jgi:metallo-beta-lactamase family protein
MLSIQFLGAAGTVTGSKHLVRFDGERELLVDCGLFQGPKQWREKNWEALPVPAPNLEWVALTHAHLDHCGWLPRLAESGFRGPAYCSSGTAELARILLPDSGHLQEEDAEHANYKGFSKHDPALPLYTEEQAIASLALLREAPFNQAVELQSGITCRFIRAGHILGSSFIELRADGRVVLFTGDMGRPHSETGGPSAPPDTDYLLLESTYGNRLHPAQDPHPQLARIITQTARRGGSVVIPAFAVERTQKLIFLLKELMEEGAMPRIPVYSDSPMAIEAMKIFLRHQDEFDEETRGLIRKHGSPLEWDGFHFAAKREESVQINRSRVPIVIVSSSGMASGGRVLHHLAQRLPDPHNTVVFVGFQAEGTRGALLQAGRPTVKIHGLEVPVRAKIETLGQFSDHADYQEIMAWLKGFARPPRRTFIVHGEPTAAQAMGDRVARELGWDVRVAQYLERIELT